MFGFWKNRRSNGEPSPADPAPSAPQEEAKKPGLFARLKDRLTRTRSNFAEGLASLVLGKKAIDDELLEELETRLLLADVGVEATQQIIRDLTARVARKQLSDADALLRALREDLLAILQPCDRPLVVPDGRKPFVILMVGVNGTGKTTTIGKLARRYKDQGLNVMLAAGDTFAPPRWNSFRSGGSATTSR